MIKKESPIKKPSSIPRLHEEQWLQLAEMLECGYPIIDSFILLQWDVEALQTHLENGVDISDILIANQKGRLYEHLRFFLRILSIEKAIRCSLEMMKFEKGLLTKLMKKSIYPLFILVFAYGMLLFFSTSIIPMMMESFAQDTSFSFLNTCVIIIQWVCQSSALVLFIGCCFLLVLFHKYPYRRHVFYRFHKHLRIVKEYVSYLFAGYIYQLE